MSNITVPHNRAWFTADLHFCHRKAAEMRGFTGDSAVADHDAWLIKTWNDRVGKGDAIFLLGDVSFAGGNRTFALLNQLHGHKVLVRGNHDKSMRPLVRRCFESEHDLLTVKIISGPDSALVTRIVCCHFPMLTWDMAHHGAWHLHGHSHGSARYPQPRGRIQDVGIDVFKGPVSYTELLEGVMKDRQATAHDYHEVREGA